MHAPPSWMAPGRMHSATGSVASHAAAAYFVAHVFACAFVMAVPGSTKTDLQTLFSCAMHAALSPNSTCSRFGEHRSRRSHSAVRIIVQIASASASDRPGGGAGSLAGGEACGSTPTPVPVADAWQPTTTTSARQRVVVLEANRIEVQIRRR